jgi:hypothetical protein
MGATAAATARADRAGDSPAGAFTAALSAAVGGAADKFEKKAVSLAGKLAAGGLADDGLDEVADGGGAKAKAGTEAVKAGLHDKNPAWAAIKGAWEAGTPAVRAAIITAVAAAVLLLLTSPVLAIVFGLSLAVIAAVHRVRGART